ncbi:MAG: DedA family protein [Betaproteobacteria bacterium]|nr:DedA family protein [Betaproteobacteria bacterium]
MVEQFIHDWGYVAVALGAFAEGETVLLGAGYAAHRGLLDFGWVVAIACACASAGDQVFYWIGRQWGRRLIERVPRLAAQFPRVGRLLQRYPHWAIVGVRFLYGLRIAGPITIGAANVSPLRFFVFNVIGAMLWAPMIAGLGWLFGQALTSLSGRLQHVEAGLLLLVALIAAIWMFARRRAARRAALRDSASGGDCRS